MGQFSIRFSFLLVMASCVFSPPLQATVREQRVYAVQALLVLFRTDPNLIRNLLGQGAPQVRAAFEHEARIQYPAMTENGPDGIQARVEERMADVVLDAVPEHEEVDFLMNLGPEDFQRQPAYVPRLPLPQTPRLVALIPPVAAQSHNSTPLARHLASEPADLADVRSRRSSDADQPRTPGSVRRFSDVLDGRVMPNRPLRVLSADDNAPMRMMHLSTLRSFQTELGHPIEVVQAESGERAFEILLQNRETPFDFAIFDRQMAVKAKEDGGMDGHDVALHWRAIEVREKRVRLPIIAFTGCTDDEAKDYMKAGADIVILKPAGRGAFIEAIADLLAKHPSSSPVN